MAKHSLGPRTRAYLGADAVTPPNFFTLDTAPSTVSEALVRPGYYDFAIGDLWLKRNRNDATPYELWMEVDKDFTTGTRLARWIRLYPGATGPVNRLEAQDANLANPTVAGNILVYGDGTILTTTADNINTLSVAILPGAEGQVLTTTGGNVVWAAGAGSTEKLEADDGNTASPDGSNTIFVKGEGNVLTTTADNVNTLTVDFTSSLDGQVPIGNNSGDGQVRWSTITQGTGVTITNLDNSITISATGTTVSGFSAHLTSNANNVTGDGTQYFIICDTEVFDTGSDYDHTTGIFTAPETGVYVVGGSIGFTGHIANGTVVEYGFQNATTAVETIWCFDEGEWEVTNFVQSGSTILSLTASDELKLYITVTAAAGKVMDVLGSSDPIYTQFYAYKLNIA